MPVNFLPILLYAFVIVALVISAKHGWKKFLIVFILIGTTISLVVWSIFYRGYILEDKAMHGDEEAQYSYSRWLENYPDKMNNIFLTNISPDMTESFYWLSESANNGYLPAIYMKGIRLKYGHFVPKPLDWTGPSGNVFAQPTKGQKLIDHALKNGFKPTHGVSEDVYYFQVFR